MQLDATDAGVRALGAYDRWVGMLMDKAVRDELRKLSRETADSSQVYQEVRSIARTLQSGFLALLFETSPDLAKVVREYGLF